jgi:hypothetical protein
MNAAITSIAPQLGKLLLMLSSSHDGEVVAAVRAIDRTLKSNRLDWHDLTQALRLPPSSLRRRDDADWHDLLAFCASRMNQLNNREREFLRSIARWHGDLTEHQRNWLESIADKLRSM